MPTRSEIDRLRGEIDALSPAEVLAWAVGEFGAGSVTLASSLGAEDQVLTHMISDQELGMRAFTLDTGRLFPESYDLIERDRDELGVALEVYFADAAEVERMVRERGVNLFYHSVENRKLCCGIRKVEPLGRALAGASAWVTGLRSEQSPSRQGIERIEWDETNALWKLSPLASWKESDVWEYIREHNVPYHPLHDRGFRSIGCAPCTRAVEPGEDARAGRWWWEHSDHKECGLHVGSATDRARVPVDRLTTPRRD